MLGLQGCQLATAALLIESHQFVVQTVFCLCDERQAASTHLHLLVLFELPDVLEPLG